MGYLSTTNANRSSKFSRGNVSVMTLFSCFILMRVSQVECGRRPDSLLLFYLGLSNIKFWSNKDPPHQSWLSISLSEEILFSTNGSCSVLELQSWFCWHSGLVGNACSFVAQGLAPIAITHLHPHEFDGQVPSRSNQNRSSVNFLLCGLKRSVTLFEMENGVSFQPGQLVTHLQNAYFQMRSFGVWKSVSLKRWKWFTMRIASWRSMSLQVHNTAGSTSGEVEYPLKRKEVGFFEKEKINVPGMGLKSEKQYRDDWSSEGVNCHLRSHFENKNFLRVFLQSNINDRQLVLPSMIVN
ncbi:hypothetical protein Tco_0260482 [Tanacetum coccineum]